MSGGNELTRAAGVIPHLVVNGAAKAIDFYTAGLGAEELSRMPGPDGKLMHAALRIQGSNVFLCDDFPEHCGGVSRAPSGASPVTLHVCVPDADAAVARAGAAGATVTMPATDMFWGDRYGQVVDPFGHSWSFSSPISAERTEAAKQQFAEMMAGKQ